MRGVAEHAFQSCVRYYVACNTLATIAQHSHRIFLKPVRQRQDEQVHGRRRSEGGVRKRGGGQDAGCEQDCHQ
eukprot:1803864-Pleurochrysis_carterae.AAC.3